MGKVDIEAALARAMTFLEQKQAADGSFTGIASPTERPFRPSASYRTVFIPALILGSLSVHPLSQSQSIRQKLASWLMDQKSPHWSFNYWANDSPQKISTPYPDDLDDTFCALLGLYRHDPSLIDETCLGHVVKLLLATESQVGGPYRTWLASADSAPPWRDIDLAVNSNIACFLRTVAQPLPNLVALIEEAIATETFTSPYYPSPYPILYYISRAYTGPNQTTLIRQILKNGWQTPLQAALVVASLLHLEVGTAQLKPGIDYLLQTQQPDGSWPVEAFWMDTEYHGSAELTTALASEALAGFQHMQTQNKPQIASTKTNTSDQIYDAILESVRHDIESLGGPLHTSATATLDMMNRAENRQEIVLLPYFFAGDVTSSRSLQKTCHQLGRANLYGWMAYTIYDDFLDDEGQPRLLSVANFALRRSLESFRRALPRHAEFQNVVEHTFDVIDAANAWEIAHCRMTVQDETITIAKLPTYKAVTQLAERSLGHTLTPIGLLTAQQSPPSSPASQSLHQALVHYLAARQLHDDAHDWEQDLRAGHCSYVVTHVLRGAQIKPGQHQFHDILPDLQSQFWHHSLPQLCQIMLRQISAARKALRQSGRADQSKAFARLLEGLEKSVLHTQKEQTSAEKFLAAYKSE